MDEKERRSRLVHDIALLILFEGADRGGESLVREVYAVFMEVSMVVGKIMDEARKAGGP